MTTAQVLLTAVLTVVVLLFTGWMITRGFQPYVGLPTAGGGIAVAGAVAGGLTIPLKRIARAWGQS